MSRINTALLLVAVLMLTGLIIERPANAAEPGTPPTGPLLMAPDVGGSRDSFVLTAQPQPATCPGDRSAGPVVWHSFITPLAVDPATLQYTADGPIASGADYTMPLLDSGRTPIVNRPIPEGEALWPYPYQLDDVRRPSPGDYHVGIACTQVGLTLSY